VLSLLDGTAHVLATLLYGSGLRSMEAVRLACPDAGLNGVSGGTRERVTARLPAIAVTELLRKLHLLV
jgi:site-specific recombinase XerD